MADGSLARRYARALVELAKEVDATDGFANELRSFVGVLDVGTGELRSVLTNPGLTTIERRAVLDKVLERLSLHAYVANFLRVLVDKNRFGAIDDILRSYQEMADELANRVRANVTSARPLPAAIAGQVQTALEKTTGKTVVLETTVDADVLGGMVVELGGVVYDASIRARLGDIEAALLRPPAQA